MDPDRVRQNLEAVREQIGSEVEVLAAVKYVPERDLPALAEAGIELVGENRAQDLLAKQEAHGDLFTWDFIGQLQSRKVKDVAPHVRLIHSLASESAMRKLEEHPAKEVLIQVNVAEEYCRKLPNCELVVEDKGQSPLAWQGARLSNLIADFFERVGYSA